MLGAYSLLKVIELELQGYLSATKGRVVCDHLVVLIIFSCSALFFFAFYHVLLKNNCFYVCVQSKRNSIYGREKIYPGEDKR